MHRRAVKNSLDLVPFCSISSSAHTSSANGNFYDTLGVRRNATQSEIKAAYYKLSKLYHPDRNKDNELAAHKFRQITEAYETLGNYSLRRRYDKGIRPSSGSGMAEPEATVDHDDSEYHDFYKSRMTKSKPPPPTGRSSIYNFDEFYRAHYSDTFKRKARTEAYMEFNAWRLANIRRQNKVNIIVFSITLIISFFLMETYAQPTYDVSRNSLGSEADNKDKSSKT